MHVMSCITYLAHAMSRLCKKPCSCSFAGAGIVFYAMRRVIMIKGHQCAVYETETLLLQYIELPRLIVPCIIASVVRFSVYPGE